MEIKESVAELRKILQEPRKSVDTWYGWHVMRAGSIFLTRIAIKQGFTPNQVTLASLVIGLLSALFFSFGIWFMGVLFINLWYLLDHVDGEVARYTKASSQSGFFFDTIINYIIEPLMFLGIGCGLSAGNAGPWIVLAVLSAFGSLLLGLIPLCEDSVILTLSRKRGQLPHKDDQARIEPPIAASAIRRLFSIWHISVTFPSVIVSLTALFLASLLIGLPRAYSMGAYLAYYAVSITGVWIAQLFYKVKSRKLDQVSF